MLVVIDERYVINFNKVRTMECVETERGSGISIILDDNKELNFYYKNADRRDSSFKGLLASYDNCSRICNFNKGI